MNAKLKINGQYREFTDTMPTTLVQLLQRLHIDEATVVAEIDGSIIPRAEFASAALREGSSVELVRFVGGG